MAARKLTVRQRRFIEEFCVDFNGTQAAIRAGYSKRTADVIASENLAKPRIKAAIQKRLDELAMSAGEATMRLAGWGRGDISPFLRLTADGEIVLDLSTAEARANLHLIRRIEVQETQDKDGVPTTRTKIELHDAKDAVIQIAKIHGLYVDRIEHSGEIKGGVLAVPMPVDADEWGQAARRQQAALAGANGNGQRDG